VSVVSTRGWGSGKLILCGEHAVVYGHPAIAFSVSLGTTVTLTLSETGTRVFPSPGISPDDPRLTRAIAGALGGVRARVEMESDLPVGRGMGSSAALAVALHRAAASLRAETLDERTLFDRAMEVEREFHGNPSGLDVAISARGGISLYRRTPDGPSLTPIACPDWQVVVLDTGRAGDTAALVAGVAQRRPQVDSSLTRIGSLVLEAARALDDAPTLGALLDENHSLLRQIGVSDDGVDALVHLARRHGALGAKLSGAGGGGVVIALTEDPGPILDAAAAAGVTARVARPTAAAQTAPAPTAPAPTAPPREPR
jgi:mevalonate kinase